MKKLLSILGAVGLTATSSGTVVACGNPAKEEKSLTPDKEGNVTHEIKDVTFKSTSKIPTSQKDWTKFFKVKDTKGEISGVVFQYLPNQNKKIIQADDVVDKAVTGTLRVYFESKVEIDKIEKITISSTNEWNEVSDKAIFERIDVKGVEIADDDKTEYMELIKYANARTHSIWISKEEAKDGEITDGEQLKRIWGSLFDIRANGKEAPSSEGNKEFTKNWSEQNGKEKFKVSLTGVNIPENSDKGTAEITIKINGNLKGLLNQNGKKTPIRFYGEATFEVTVNII